MANSLELSGKLFGGPDVASNDIPSGKFIGRSGFCLNHLWNFQGRLALE